AATGLAGPFAKIGISNPQASVQAGDGIQLGAQAMDKYGNPVPPPPSFSWMSSNAGIATVTSAGFVIVRNIGSATISASSGGIAGSIPLSITTGITFAFGAEETVFNWATDSCEPLDVPDVPAHAVRLADGTLMLADGDAPRNYGMFGADFS